MTELTTELSVRSEGGGFTTNSYWFSQWHRWFNVVSSLWKCIDMDSFAYVVEHLWSHALSPSLTGRPHCSCGLMGSNPCGQVPKCFPEETRPQWQHINVHGFRRSTHWSSAFSFQHITSESQLQCDAAWSYSDWWRADIHAVISRYRYGVRLLNAWSSLINKSAQSVYSFRVLFNHCKCDCK